MGEVQLFGSQYAMRIWLDPQKLSSYGMTPTDVATAVHAQNAQVSAGQLGGAPAVRGQQLNATITAQTRLQTRRGVRGHPAARRRPTARRCGCATWPAWSWARQLYDVDSMLNNGRPAAIGIKLAPGANALATAEAVKARIDELSTYFPHGVQVDLSLRHHHLRPRSPSRRW